MIFRRRNFDHTNTTEEARGGFLVHPSIEAGLVPEPERPGFFRVRAGSRSSGGEFRAAPTLEGSTIRAKSTSAVSKTASTSRRRSSATGRPKARWSDRSPAPTRSSSTRIRCRPRRARIAWRDQVEVATEPMTVRDGYCAIEVELAAPHEDTVPQLVMPVSADSALFYFFSKDNWELMVKVLDGCAINGHLWVYAAASTDVGYTLRVKDRFGGRATREYVHPAGPPAPALTDGEAFVCPCPVCSGASAAGNSSFRRDPHETSGHARHREPGRPGFCLAAARPAAAGVNLSLQKRFFEGDEGPWWSSARSRTRSSSPSTIR